MNQHVVYRQLKCYARRVHEARNIIMQGLTQCEHPYVACSFGKDSAVLLHLVLQQRPDVNVRFLCWDETELLNDYQHVIQQWRDRFPLRLSVLSLSRVSLDETVPDRWGQLAALEPCDGFFIGLRAAESKGRRITLRTHGAVYRMKNNLVRVAPLAWWSTADIGAYVDEHELPMLASYAIDGIESRTTARVPRDDYGIRNQALGRLKARDIVRYNALRQVFPEVADYA